MVLSIDATQDARSQIAAIRPIILVTLTITQPSTTVYRFSQGYRTYGGNEYLDFLAGITPVRQAIAHLGNPPIPDSVTLRLANGSYGSGTLLAEFLGKTIENATVRVEELLLGPSESRSAPSSSGPVTRFLGRVKRISKIGKLDFEIECTDELLALDDKIDWYVVKDGDGAPPSEVNKRLPRPYGNDVLVRCVGWDLGASTTLAVDMTAAVTGNVKFTDVTLFPTGTNSILLGGEKITYNGKNDANQTLNITVRGVAGGSAAVAHKIGETVIELQANHYWIAADGADLKAVNKIYFKSPSTRKLVDITGVTGVSSNLADASRVSGRTVTSIRVTNAALETLKSMDDISQQPAAGGGEITFGFDENFSTSAQGGGFPSGTWYDGLTSIPHFIFDSGGANTIFRFTVLAKDATTVITALRVGFVAKATRFFTGSYIQTLTVQALGPSGAAVSASASASWTSPTDNNVVKSAQSAWVTITSPPHQVDDLVNAGLNTGFARLSVAVTSALNQAAILTDMATITLSKLTVEVQTAGGLTTNAAVFTGGFGLELYANVDGYKVPAADTTYSVSAGTTIERDHDIARHILQVTAGQASGTLDSTWNTQGAIETTSSEHAFDLRDLGEKLSEVLANLANESRANIFLDAGTWRFIRRPKTAPRYVSSGIAFSNTNVLVAFDPSVKGLELIKNTLAAMYGFDPSMDGVGEDQYAGRLSAVDATSVTAHGTRMEVPYIFRTILLAAVAQATLDELLQEMKGRRWLSGIESPYYDTFKLQLADVIDVTFPFLGAAVGARVIGIDRDLVTQRATLQVIEVPTS